MKTVSLELSKELKEAGFPQVGEFDWQRSQRNQPYKFNPGGSWETADKDGRITSPTADEILDFLPDLITSNEYGDGFLIIEKHSKDGGTIIKWKIAYRDRRGKNLFDPTFHRVLAEAAGLMWLYLKKENLL